MQDQHARSRGVVQVRPGELDLLQLAENLDAEDFDNGPLVAALGPGQHPNWRYSCRQESRRGLWSEKVR